MRKQLFTSKNKKKKMEVGDVIENEKLRKKRQEATYRVLEILKDFHTQLKPENQMKVPHEILITLANTLVENNLIFQIVEGLIELQHMTEKKLWQNRVYFNRLHEEQITEILKNETMSDREKVKQIVLVKMEQREKLKELDLITIAELDEKQREQQITLQQAAVPGFFETSQRKDIEMQMHLIDFIIRLKKIIGTEDLLAEEDL